MNWLTPGLAAGAAAVAVPTLVLLYFLKLRRRDVEVSTTLLWKKSIQDMQANAPFQRLRKNLLLFLQLLALAAALLAIGQPQLFGGGAPPDRLVILIDRSGSMGALDETDADGQTISRLDRAKLDAIAQIDALPDGGLFGGDPPTQAMVIAFDSGAEVVQPFTDSKAQLIRAIEGIDQTDAPTMIGEAMKLASAYVGPRVVENEGLRPGAPIRLYSDGGIPDLDAVRLHPDSVFTYRAAGRADSVNVGITSIDARRPFDQPERAEVFVALQSTAAEPTEATVELAIDGEVVAARSTQLVPDDAGGPAIGGVRFALDRTERAIVSASIVRDDALRADNTGWLVLPPAKRLGVRLVTRGGLFLRASLNRLNLASFDELTPEAFEAAAATGQLAPADVTIFHGWAPERPLPAGRYVVIDARPNLPGVSPTSSRAQTNENAADAGDDIADGAAADGDPVVSVVIDAQRDHPVARFVPSDGLSVRDPLSLEAGDASRVLLRGSEGPLMLETAAGDVRALVLGFDPADTFWVLDASFPVFVAAAVRYLAQDAGELASVQLSPGETLSQRLSGEATDATLDLPGRDGGVRRTVALEVTPDGRVNYGPLPIVGLHRLSWEGEPGPRDTLFRGRATRIVPVNMANRAESAVPALSTIELPTGEVEAVNVGGAAEAGDARRLWPWLLAAALAVIMLEWWVYNRRTYL
jgi:hypothetical protein